MTDVRDPQLHNGEAAEAAFEDVVEAASLEDVDFPYPRPFPTLPPIRLGVSGLYERSSKVIFPRPDVPIRPIPQPIPDPIPVPRRGPVPPRPGPGPDPTPIEGATPILPFFLTEELRLDVDGRYPQNVASGLSRSTFIRRVNWIANVTKTGPGKYAGAIFYKDGDTASFPYTDVEITVTGGWYPPLRSATAKFTGGGAVARTTTYKYKSPYFHPVDFEFDCAEGVTPTLEINTGDHPNRPATIAVENLSIRTVFRRAGFDVTTSAGSGVVPVSGAGSNATWSDQEMHDAMQSYWSRFQASSQWALWTFFASLHDQGTSLGGVMFDDIGAQHRQGTAIFVDSFIKEPPAGDAAPDAWIRRMTFWTACHEMGHAFNLAHSWQKSLVHDGKGPWVPLTDDTEARSFMNYPYFVNGGEASFFSDFEFRFVDPELLFMRHAPSRFVQMGNALWFDHHGFEGANVSPAPSLALEVRVNRDRAIFEFLEPVNLELKLTNITSQPQLVPSDILDLDDDLTVVVKRDRCPAQQLLPVARYCAIPDVVVLQPGESMYKPLLGSAGLKGWAIDEPGNYTVQVALHRDGEDVVSNQLRIRVAPPKGYDEEYVAQDFLTTDVARVLALGGTEQLTAAKDALREVAERLPNTAAAVHAAIALGKPLTRDYKRLTESGSVVQPLEISVRPAEPEAAKDLLGAALMQQAPKAVETLGHIEYRSEVEQMASFLAAEGDRETAVVSTEILRDTLASREVNGRKVLGSVIAEVQQMRDEYAQ